MHDDEDRSALHKGLEDAAKESKGKAEERQQELVANRDRDLEDADQKLGVAYGLPGAMLTDASMPHREGAADAEYTSPRHSGTGEWATPSGGGGSPQQARRSRKAESEASA